MKRAISSVLVLLMVLTSVICFTVSADAAVAKPNVTLSNSVKGVSVTWTKSAGATRYVVYRRMKTTDSWTALKSVSATAASYIDTGAVNGKTHYYTVRAFSGSARSSFTAKSVFFVAAPSSIKLTALVKGFKVTWGTVKGASQYRVYRRQVDAAGKVLVGWNLLTTTKNLSYSDAGGLANGKYYEYCVRAYNATGKAWSGLRISPRSCFLAAPTVKLANATGGVSLSWNKTAGAAKYNVYRRLKTTDSWTLLKSVTALKYTDSAVVNAKQYYYAVRACTTGAKSGYTAMSIYYVAVPGSVKLTPIDGNSFKVTWGAVSGASQYRVYRRQVNASGTVLVGWSLLTTTRSRTYSDDSGLEPGAFYEYCVRAYNATGKTWSGLSAVLRAAVPTLGCVNALDRAKSYLSLDGFSEKRLRTQLDYDGFTSDEIDYAIANCKANWKEECCQSAQSNLVNGGGFSEKGLRRQLDFEGFTTDEIEYAMKNCTVNWNEQCYTCAKTYMENVGGFSAASLRSQLEFEGFTSAQIDYALAKVGY